MFCQYLFKNENKASVLLCIYTHQRYLKSLDNHGTSHEPEQKNTHFKMSPLKFVHIRQCNKFKVAVFLSTKAVVTLVKCESLTVEIVISEQ